MNSFDIGTHRGIASRRFDTTPAPPPKVQTGAFAVMGDSASGLEIMKKIVTAYFFLTHWPFVDRLLSNFWSNADLAPFAARARMLNQSWEQWVGE